MEDVRRIADPQQAGAWDVVRNPRIRRITYANLLDAEDLCLEWHAWYEDPRGDTWQIDMIHIAKVSRYAGYFERVADRINAVIDEEQRDAILSIKYAIPEGRQVMGVKIYMAVNRFVVTPQGVIFTPSGDQMYSTVAGGLGVRS